MSDKEFTLEIRGNSVFCSRTPQTPEEESRFMAAVIKVKSQLMEEVAKDAVSVIIVQAPCALLKSNKPKPAFHIDTDKCKRCYMCMKPACPAITKADDGTVSINATMCNGCGLCSQICPCDAIGKAVKE